jgi:type III pantothenate kinase
MILAIDIGNTNIVIGVFHQDVMIEKWRIATSNQYTEDEYASKILPLLITLSVPETKITGAIISSVVKAVTKPMATFIEKYLKCTPMIAKNCNHDLTLKVDEPEKLGSDILANAVASNHLYKNSCIFVDFGTALVIGAVTKQKEFLGATISPGINAAYNALINKADLLFDADLDIPSQVLGKNTVAAMSSGIYLFYIDAVNGIISRIRKEHKQNFRVVVTGGLAGMICD